MYSTRRAPKLLIAITIFSATIFLFSPTICGKVVHIAPTGSDATGNGSEAYPYFSLNRAEDDVVPGDSIFVHSGVYTTTNEYWGVLDNMLGTDDQWITITGAPGENMPILDGIALYITTTYLPAGTITNHLRIENIEIRNTRLHGINIDDGGEYRRDYPTHHIEFTNLRFTSIGYAGIKMSGINDFHFRNIVYENPTNLNYPGIAIDCVACHDGIIEDCTFRNIGWQCINNPQWFTSGLMIKGGSRNIIVRDCYIENVHSACLVGQITDINAFRPPIGQLDPDGDIVNYEAKNISYYSNIIVNASIPITFSNSIGGKFYNNTIYCPINYGDGEYEFTHFAKLKAYHSGEVNGVMMARDQYGEVKNNIVVFGRAYGYYPDGCILWCQDEYNLFSTFTFDNNLLYCIWDPEYSNPDLTRIIYKDGDPSMNNNIYGQDPLWVDMLGGDFRLSDQSIARNAGLVLPSVINDFNDYLYDSVAPSLGALEFPMNGSTPAAPRPNNPAVK